MPSSPRSPIEYTWLEMSSSGAGSRAPPGLTTRTRPFCSEMKVRPSGAHATAVGPVSPAATVRSSKPAGSVAAEAVETPHASAARTNPAAAAALAKLVNTPSSLCKPAAAGHYFRPGGGSAALAGLAPPHQHHQAVEQPPLPGAVREHRRLPAHREPGDQNGLPRAVLPDALAPVARPEPRLARAAERRLLSQVVHQCVVHTCAAGRQPPRDPLALGGVAGEHARVEPVAGVVGEPDRLLRVAHLHHRQDRAEGLVGHHLHRVVDARHHRRLEELPGAGAAVAAHEDLRALVY